VIEILALGTEAGRFRSAGASGAQAEEKGGSKKEKGKSKK
jgi:hypothetical protein